MAEAADPARWARPRWGMNHLLAYGQSLSSGWEGWPALSTTARDDVLMIGDSVRPVSESAPNWRPVGEPALRPLRATVQDNPSGALLRPVEVAGLAGNSVCLGETILEGACAQFRFGVREDDGSATRLLASSCGVGGRSIEQLSRGASPELFNRLRDCVRLGGDLARGASLTYGVAAILLLQGENNNWGTGGATADGGEYKRLLRRLYADIIVDVAAGIARQHDPPALFTYQCGGDYASETNAIPQAQLDTALELPTCFLVAPAYPVTSKGGHLDANGYRWLGAQFGKVMHRVLVDGEDWRPLYPLDAVRDGAAVEIAFHVPSPPLRFGRPAVVHVLREIVDQGFTLLDDSGAVPITSVSLSGEDRVRIVPGRSLGNAVRVRYANAAHSGRGGLHDSDTTIAADKYEYEPGRGHWPTAAIADLIDRPYPLMNWCVAFTIDVG